MRLAAYFSQSNYARHGLPIVAELRTRGVEVDVWARDAGAPWGPALVDHVHRASLPPLILVASQEDARRFRDRQLIYAEHGAGQTYSIEGLEDGERILGFAGADGLDHVVLFLAPSERVADLWRAAYPQATVETVGCPALDRYAGCGNRADIIDAKHTVAITAHHPTFGAIPECRPAIDHFAAVLPHLRIDLARAGIELVGHAHPRGSGAMIRRWENLGIRYEPDPDVILSTASLLIADNTSLLFEAAAISLPVLALNAPWYRRGVEHGLRFWSHVPGLQCDEPRDLARMVAWARTDPPAATALRTRAAQYAYSSLDGHAAARAADAILKIEGADPMSPSPASENADRTDELIDRIYQLGGSDDQAAAIRSYDDPDELERLFRLNDHALAAEIHQASAEASGAMLPDLADIEEQAQSEEALDALGAALLDDAADDGVIMDTVGADPDLAARLFRLESARDPNSPELLAELAAVAGIAYTASDGTAEPGGAETSEEGDIVAAEPIAAGDEIEISEA